MKQFNSLQFNMMEETKAKFITWVKIRIGEPLTAIEVDQEKVIFGAISGYVGYFNLQNKKTTYFDHIDEELIRGIHSDITLDHKKIYIAIGDKDIRIKDFKKQGENDQKLIIQRSHSSLVCSHSMTMMHGVKIVIFCAYPTQKRQTLGTSPVELELQNKNLYEIDACINEIKLHRQFRMPEVAVPFDFDGSRILWLQYQADGRKQFQFYDLAQKKVNIIKAYEKQYHFLSHGRLAGKELIFVQNNKNVKSYHMESKVQRDLYSHNSSIVAFSLNKLNGPQYEIVSVDFNGLMVHWKGSAVRSRCFLWDSPQVPRQIRKHQYLFDMGYAYYVKMEKGILALTTDKGLFVFSV